MDLLCLITMILILLISMVFCWYLKRMNYWRIRGIPHGKAHWLKGHMEGIKTKYHMKDICSDYYHRFKGKAPFAGFYLYYQPMAFVTDLNLIRNILIKDFPNFANRNSYVNAKDCPLSAHLLGINGAEWKNMRTKLTPTFTSTKMKLMFSVVLQVGQQFVKVLDSEVIKSREGTNNCDGVEVYELFARYTTDVIGKCAFSLECQSLSHDSAEFLVMGRRAFKGRNINALSRFLGNEYPKLANMLGILLFPQEVTTFFLKVLKEAMAHREENNVRVHDLLDTLMGLKNNPGDKLSFEQCAAQAFVFFLAGFETSSSTGSYALYELARHPQIQQRLRQEILETLAKHNNELTYECLHEMKYLEQVMLETLRLHTIISVLQRRTKNDYLYTYKGKSYTIEKNTALLIPCSAIHLDPEYYPQPHEFNPDNFSAEKLKERDVLTFLGFSDGPRNCIGLRFGKMQSGIGLVLLLQHFKFSVGPKTQIPLEIDNADSMLAPKAGIHLRVERI